MRQFIVLAYGYEEPTPEVMQAWGQWFTARAAHLTDPGHPLAGGREVTASGSRDLESDSSPLTGYCVISAESFDEAEKLLEGLPIIDSVRIYEAVSM